MSEPFFEVFGGERIGDKAAALREHMGLLSEVGLNIPQTSVIASEATAEVRQDSNIPLGNEAQVFTAQFLDSLSTPAVVVRSSAEKDARGSGVYESVITARNPERVATATRSVLASFSLPHALDFRQSTGCGEDFAVMIQPLIGQPLDRDETLAYGPPLSGYAYSSSLSEPEGLINVVAGIGGGVSRRGGEVIRPVDATIGSFDEIVTERILGSSVLAASDFRPARSYSRDYVNALVYSDYFADVPDGGVTDFTLSKGLDMGTDYTVDFDDTEAVGRTEFTILTQAMRAFQPGKLFDQLAEIESRAGYPVYIEWALTHQNGESTPYVVQIAPYEQDTLAVPEVEFEERYMACHTVTGSGIKTADRIVTCWNPDDVAHLRRYNADPENAGYILFFSSRMTTSWLGVDSITWRDCNKAAVLIELQDARHANGGPVEHLKGAVDITDKFFGVHDWERTHASNMMDAQDSQHVRTETWKADGLNDHGLLEIEHGDFIVRADESANTMIVGRPRIQSS